MYRQTGIHFFNIPCQATSWNARISCPTNKNSNQCKLRECSAREQQVNELKCNTPMCDGEDACIPVYFTPADLKPAVSYRTFQCEKTDECLEF